MARWRTSDEESGVRSQESGVRRGRAVRVTPWIKTSKTPKPLAGCGELAPFRAVPAAYKGVPAAYKDVPAPYNGAPAPYKDVLEMRTIVADSEGSGGVTGFERSLSCF